MNILVNLPNGFFVSPHVNPEFDRLRALGEVRCTSHNDASEITADLAWADAVIMWSWPVLTDDLLDLSPQLMYRGHLDLNQAGAQIALMRGVPVSISRSGFSPTVAEMALSLILSCLRRLSDYHAQMRSGLEHWVSQIPADLDPLERELTGASVGIVGLGNVGRRLAALLEPFDCRIAAFDPYLDDAAFAKASTIKRDLDNTIGESDIVVICAASNEGSAKLFDARRIALLPPNAVFVNVARSALVDTDALAARLAKGDLIAALDVFDTEPLPLDSPLRSLPNVFLTPHRAGATITSVRRILDYLIDDLEAVIAGKARQHPLKQTMISGLDR